MSRLRNTSPADPNTYCPTGGAAYFLIYNAVKDQKGLIHGKLHDYKGAHCAIGSLFDAENKIALPNNLIDEVAAVNDCRPNATPKQRKSLVLSWLRKQLKFYGYTGLK